MQTYSIADLEKLSGIKSHTIRIWEKRYNIVSPERTDTNIRAYNDDQLKKILNISFLINNGLKISKIASLSLDELSSKVLSLTSSTRVELWSYGIFYFVNSKLSRRSLKW